MPKRSKSSPTKEHRELLIIYLGKRGGGSHFTIELCSSLLEYQEQKVFKVVVSSSNLNKIAFHDLGVQTIQIQLNSTRDKLRLILKAIFRANKLMQDFGVKQNSVIIAPMVNPFDLVPIWQFRKRGVKIIRVIHDAKKHPGDLWPGRLTIRAMMRHSDNIVTLSKSVAKELPSPHKAKIVITKIPAFQSITQANIRDIQVREEYALIIGRIKRYKGIEVLLSAWSIFESKSNLQLVIAGEGQLPRITEKRIKVINRWLEEGEMHQLIQGAKFVVFAYQETSQSGLIPVAMAYAKNILITPLNGLVEQVTNYNSAFICEGFSAKEIADGLVAINSWGATTTIYEPQIGDNWVEPILSLISKY